MADSDELSPYTTEQLAPIREVLLRRRRELVDSHHAQARDLAEEQSRAPVAEEEEAAAQQHAQFIEASVREGDHWELVRVDQAIARIDAGIYGLCDECEEPIPIERLAILPYTRLCAPDASREEREKVLHSPGRSLTF